MDIEGTIVAEDTAAQAAGTGAPRVTYEGMKAKIKGEYYFTAQNGLDGTGSDELIPELGLLTFCVLVIANGFTVVGKSACASPENFNEQFGRELACKDAIDQLWTLEGYLLKEDMAREASLNVRLVENARENGHLPPEYLAKVDANEEPHTAERDHATREDKLDTPSDPG